MAYALNDLDDSHRQDGVVYFSGDTSPGSWAGVIGDEHDMTDQQVQDYIMSTKPELFTKLHGMKFGSSDIPLTFSPMRALRRLDAIGAGRQYCNLSNPLNATYLPTSVISEHPRSSLERVDASAFYSTQPFRNKDPHREFPEDDQKHARDQLKLDGVAQKDVLSAAERLYPRIQPAKTVPPSFRDKNTEPDQAFMYAPNSKEALDRRALKQLEINETLAEVTKCEKALKTAKLQLHHLQVRSPSPDASVLITRPSYMEPRDDRYKKQGLTPYDRVKCIRELHQTSTQHVQRTVKNTPKKAFVCYCREPDNGRELVRCSQTWCPVAWYHLDCIGLDRLPYLNEEFHCCYCSDGLGFLVTDAHLDQVPHGGNDFAGKLVGSVSQHYLDNEIETEVVFEEHDARRRKGTNVPGKYSIYSGEYDDEGTGIGSDVTSDESWAAEEHTRLHDKIVKWRAVNDPYQRSNISGNLSQPIVGQKSAATSTISFFEDDSDDNQNSEEDFSSENDTVRASSPVAATTVSDGTLNDDKENNPEEFNEMEEAGMTDSELTAVDSAEEADDEDDDELAYLGHRTVTTRNLTSNSSTATTLRAFTPQPLTMTNSSHTRANNDRNGSFRTSFHDPSTHFPSFNQSVAGPQTPTLAPRKSEKPWGTPVNLGYYESGLRSDLVTEPGSPSTDRKRKFAQVDLLSEAQDDVQNMDAGSDHDDEQVDQVSDGDQAEEGEYDDEAQSDEEDQEEEGEMIEFVLDQQE